MKTKLLFLSLISFFATAQNNRFISKAEEQKTLIELKAKAIFDKETEVSYIFETFEENEKVRYVAQKNNIFYATPNVLNLYIANEKDVIKLKSEGNSIKKVAEKVYQVKVTGNMQKAKETFQKKQGVKYVVYEYFAYTSACITWNDPQATITWGGGYGQLHLTSVDYSPYPAWANTPTHAIDSVDVWKQMHTESTIANPNVVINVIDGGIETSNSDLSNNILYSYDFVNNTSGNGSSNHGTSVASLLVANANNNYGGVGVAHNYPLRTLDTGGNTSTVITLNYLALDDIYNYSLNNNSKKMIVNMSISTGNDPIVLQKIQQSYNLQNNSQVFFIGAGGNSGATTISYPAGWSEVFAIGAVNAEDPNKALWSGSNTGSSIDFVGDGQNVRIMSTTGTFSLGNGTSYSSPIVAGAVAHLVSQDPTANFQTIYNRLKGGAKDLGTTGFDTSYGWGYARTASSLKYAVVEDVPLTIDCGGNSSYTYNFTPKFYNHATKTVNRKCYYPNGQQVPFILNGDGTVTFQVAVNTNNGFSATNPAVNRLRYEFYPLGYATCLTSIKSKLITITNLATLSINEVSLEDSFSIYPNPANDFIIINNTNWIKSKTLYSITGQLIKQENNQNEKIDISNLQQGLYLLEIETTNNQKVTKKIVKN
jgi:hypothetical protein